VRHWKIKLVTYFILVKGVFYVKKTIFGGLLFVGGSILLAGAVIANNGMSNFVGFPGLVFLILGIVLGVSGLQKDS
jgi:hypothetical protein